MALHSEAEISQDIVNIMTRCESEELVNSYDTGRESIRIKITMKAYLYERAEQAISSYLRTGGKCLFVTQIIRMLLTTVKDYLVNSTFHGLRFIAEDGRHWTERTFWLLCCILSWIGSAKLIGASWDGFQNNAISFVVETTYLNVETSFPSISVCEDDNLERVKEKIKKTHNESHECNLEEVYRELVYFVGTVYFVKYFCDSEPSLQCPTEHYRNLSMVTKSSCEQTFLNCKWKNMEFDCCRHFRRIYTEYGICFSLNAKEKVSTKSGLHDLISSTDLGLGKLEIQLMVPAKVYIHTETDIPYYNTMTTDIIPANKGEHKRIGISVTDIENAAEVRQLSVSQRKCRFPDENYYLSVSKTYSYSACVVQCRMQAQLDKCNCTSHLMPNTDESQHCTMAGILCLTKHADFLSRQKTRWSDKEGLDCSCLPGCEEPEFNVVRTETHKDHNESLENISTTNIHVFRHPSHRYKRNVVHGHMDLVVSMGGTASLFVGASLLSFIEFIYFFTIRLYNNKIMKREKLPVNLHLSPSTTKVAPLSTELPKTSG